MNSKTTPVLVLLLVVAAFLVGSFWTKIQYLEETKGIKKTEETKVGPATPPPAILGEQLESTIGNFQITKDEICQENGKPIVYLFGSESCPHCRWEKPIFEKVVTKFTDKIVVHNNIDKQVDMEVFQKYSSINQGGIPFLVLGCRYARVGSGEQAGEAEEEKNLTALICKLTADQPEKICAEVKD